MPADIAAYSAASDNDLQSKKREFDRWRIAVDMVRRLREAGIICDLAKVQNHS
jgi:hypothetical protein